MNLDIVAERPASYQVSDGNTLYWLPKSQVSHTLTGKTSKKGFSNADFTMPEWLAHEKGLV